MSEPVNNPFRNHAERYKKMLQNMVSGDRDRIEYQISQIEELSKNFDKPKTPQTEESQENQ